MKKVINKTILVAIICCVFSLLMFSFSSQLVTVYAETNDKPLNTSLQINGKAGYLLSENGTVLGKKDELTHYPIASMTKIMTLNIIFDQIEKGKLKLNTIVNVSENASSMGGSQIFLDPNTKHKASGLIKSIVVASANDSSVAMAEHVSGSVENFVTAMNNKAKELGMENTNFVNCTGLPVENHYSCAKDVAVMFSNLMKHKDYFKFSKIWLEDYEHPDGRKTVMTNTNKLIRFYKGCDCGKTGFTNEAKHCLCASACRNNMRVIAVVIGADSSKERFQTVKEMFNYSFKNYHNRVIVPQNKVVGTTKVVGGKEKTIKLILEKPLTVFCKRGEKVDYKVSYKLPKSIKAPLKKGDSVGTAFINYGDNNKSMVNIIVSNDIEKGNYLDSLDDIYINW